MTDSTNRLVPLTSALRPRPRAGSAGRLPALAAATALGLALAGCSGGADGDQGESSPSAPSSTASGSGPAGETPAADAAGSSTSGSPSGAASSAEAGPYEPASSMAPAKNVPVPEMPETVKEPTRVGLEAAFEYWWVTQYYLNTSGDPAPMKQVSAEDCALCTDLLETWPAAYEEGFWAVLEPATTDVKVSELDAEGGTGTGLIEVEESGSKVYEPDGGLLEDSTDPRPKPVTWAVAAAYSTDEGLWRITHQEILE